VPRQSESVLAAIKSAVDIVALVGDYLPLTRSGSKYKAVCPFHDDHKPSLELNPDRQSYKCWSCGAGGDVFDFVREYERVDFSEALRMLAERAGVTLDAPSPAPAAGGSSKTELLAVNAWAESAFVTALESAPAARAYAEGRGLTPEVVARFRLGYAPADRGWLVGQARRAGFPVELLERAGLVSRPEDAPGQIRERFRGRLIFPIHDFLGRPIAFGGRVLPETEKALAAAGRSAAKYLNGPETALFQKRKVLYAWDHARAAAREAGWVAVVEGYTDVIAAHQSGLRNVVGTLGTALGGEHVQALRRLADRVVLVFDGDDAGQKAADRSLELFLGHEVDVRVLSLPDDLDPCDFLLREGADAFRALVGRAVDPLAFALSRAATRFDLGGIEGSRQAAEWVLEILARVPSVSRVGLDVKVAKALDTLSARLRVPVATLERRLRDVQRAAAKAARPLRPAAGPARGAGPRALPNPNTDPDAARPLDVETVSVPISMATLDPVDRGLIQVALNEPESVGFLITRVAVSSLVDAPLRAILQACYDLYGEGESTTFGRVALRLADSRLRTLAAGLLLPTDSGKRSDAMSPEGRWQDRLGGVLARLARRDWEERIRALEAAKGEALRDNDHAAYQALYLEHLKLISLRPVSKKHPKAS